MMAGLLQRPESLRPDRHPQRALARRNTVLRAMESNGAITRRQMDSALALPLDVKMKEFEQVSGDEAAYFVEIGPQGAGGALGQGFPGQRGHAHQDHPGPARPGVGGLRRFPPIWPPSRSA